MGKGYKGRERARNKKVAEEENFKAIGQILAEGDYENNPQISPGLLSAAAAPSVVLIIRAVTPTDGRAMAENYATTILPLSNTSVVATDPTDNGEEDFEIVNFNHVDLFETHAVGDSASASTSWADWFGGKPW